MFFEMTYQVRVTDFIEGQKWYETLLGKTPDFIPHDGFAEWELIPGCWLQIAEGTPSEGSGPLRLAVRDIKAEKERLFRELNVAQFEIFSRQEVPVKWANFTDPWGNQLGLFEYINKSDEILEEKVEVKILGLLNEIYPLDLIKVESITNEMFRCTAKDGVYFARITNYKNYDEQLEEVKYTNFLYKEGLGVSPTIVSLNRKIVEKVILNNKEVLTILYKSAPGVHLPRNQWNAEILKELGRQIGRLHRISKKFEEIHTPKFINDWHVNEEYAFLSYIPKEETAIREIAQEVLSTIKEIPQNHSNYGLLHGDLWLENTLVDGDNNLTMIDFQDCEKHYYIYDLAVPIYSALEYSFVGGGNIADYGRNITNAIIDGYQEENDLPKEMLDQLPLFIKLKEVFEYSLMHMYWDKEKLTENQMRIMNHFRMRIEHNYSLLNVRDENVV